MQLSSPDSFAGKRVTVMGLGRFGGGVGVVRFLAARQARITVTDLASEDALADSLAEIADCRIEALHLGGHFDRDFEEADLIVASPAVPRSNRYLQAARERGVPVTSEMNLFWQLQRGRIIGVTGSNGKSTTTAAIHGILAAAGWDCSLGGNIGASLLPKVDAIGPEHWSVLELSSFQLDDLASLRRSPDAAVVTNFTPNHLDRHVTLEQYREAKQTILRWQRSSDVAVLNRDDADVSQWETRGGRWWFGTAAPDGVGDVCGEGGVFRDAESGELVLRRPGEAPQGVPLGDWIKLPGRHNLQNAMAAAAVVVALGVPLDAVREGLLTFGGLPHRLERVGEWRGRTFYNDSIATTPESVAVALESFERPIVLLAGGYDKGIELQAFAALIESRVKGAALMGQTGPVLDRLMRSPQRPPRKLCASFEEAFAWAVEHSAPGDIVLLSPGCASYDWFPHFAERGRRFSEAVRRLPE